MRDCFALHPATRILLWISLAAYAFVSGPRLLAVLSLALAVLLILQGNRLFFRLLRRIRWILLSLLAIYAFETPGEYFFPAMGGPTFEGVVSGGIQAWRIVLTIALLAFLQGSTSREEMLSGIYALLLPFRRWFDVERIAVRLLLTLHYAGERGQGDWRERIFDAFRDVEHPLASLKLPLYHFRMRDGAAFLALVTVLAL